MEITKKDILKIEKYLQDKDENYNLALEDFKIELLELLNAKIEPIKKEELKNWPDGESPHDYYD